MSIIEVGDTIELEDSCVRVASTPVFEVKVTDGEDTWTISSKEIVRVIPKKPVETAFCEGRRNDKS